MRLIRVEQLCEAGSGPVNEDAVGYNDFGGWVLDGATSLSGRTLTPNPSDPHWYSQWWNRFFQENLNHQCSLTEFCATGINQIASEYHREWPHATSGDYPSAAATVVRFSGEQLEYQIFGDALLILRDQQGVQLIRDNRLCKLDDLVLHEMNHLINHHGLSHDRARHQLLPKLREHRQLKNQTGGYWTLEFEAQAAHQGLQGSYRPDGELQALLLTDGLSILIDTFEHCTPTELLDHVAEYGLRSVYDQVRALEASDPNLSEFTRFKASDDATGLYFVASTDHESSAR